MNDTNFYPALTGSKTPTPKCGEYGKSRWETTARKCPIGSTNNQWEGTKHPLIKVSLYYKNQRRQFSNGYLARFSTITCCTLSIYTFQLPCTLRNEGDGCFS
ncbi:hypothetical protein COL26_06610 [Bacillus thuringiensis]|uniref:Uncharacterized protein n=1 Tax=Bacillus thuringiensis TaxID=1428 RepID=A0A9X6ZTE2_BACTU|nr:hypothetical protein F8510_19505 [Bacillus sp. RM2(2019)]OTW80543.1 hypothetical protein BK710_22815 [Bacillus thuringiensis serovar sumiyoshiensis]OTW91474.1 hypothetical protein BK711_29035 [Bacillus thuringiensis serovar fukuokaensis]PEB09322.1 hypothetical protein COM67_28210 [Bacillus thuringiensis]PEB70671.1 hypothetical protein COM91_06505 [Bacillus thuringiensis]